jgi:hypothetical protein
MKNKSPMKTRHYSQKAIIATLPGVLPVMVRKKSLILTPFFLPLSQQAKKQRQSRPCFRLKN